MKRREERREGGKKGEERERERELPFRMRYGQVHDDLGKLLKNCVRVRISSKILCRTVC